MDKPHGILVFGANGSGKTTLGGELARLLGYKHMDIEDYHFAPSAIPYTVERSRADCLRLMLADIDKHRTFVITAVTGDFGQDILPLYELAIFLSAPKALRMERIEQRAERQHGARVQKGGDLYASHRKFVNFAAMRPLERIDQWAQTLQCPVVRMDGAVDWQTNAAWIVRRFYSEQGCFDTCSF